MRQAVLAARTCLPLVRCLKPSFSACACDFVFEDTTIVVACSFGCAECSGDKDLELEAEESEGGGVSGYWTSVSTSDTSSTVLSLYSLARSSKDEECNDPVHCAIV